MGNEERSKRKHTGKKTQHDNDDDGEAHTQKNNNISSGWKKRIIYMYDICMYTEK